MSSAGVVEFDWSIFSVRYEEIAHCITENKAKVFFKEAQLYCDNTACSPIVCLEERELLLYMMTAHLLALNVGMNGQPSSPLVGRVSSASEGSVSVSVENSYPPGSAQWYQQTKYGAQFCAATGKYRHMFYVPGQEPNFEPFYYQ